MGLVFFVLVLVDRHDGLVRRDTDNGTLSLTCGAIGGFGAFT
jgi:hypothetical protein